VRASVGDRHGNLIYHHATRNFNPLCAMSGRITIAEVEELVEPGEIDPENVQTPGIFVQRIVRVGAAGKRIERVTTRKRGA
jgi:3-oxoacid CoA-transferase subunit A